MSAKHTPGTWTASPWTSTKRGEVIAAGWNITAGGHLVPMAFHACIDDDNSEADANAHLMAAAPCLLAALQAYDRWADAVVCRDPELAAIRQQMRAAIAKAAPGQEPQP